MCGQCGCGDTGNKGCCDSSSKGGCGDNSCGPQSCESSSGSGCGCEGMGMEKQMYFDMLELADAAWMKLMKQKMMALLEKKIGKDMDKMAEFMVEQNGMRWMDEEAWMKNKEKALEAFAKMMMDKKKK